MDQHAHRLLAGLTLLELLIGLAVLAVLGTLAVPGLGSQLDRQRLRHAAQTLAADLNETRFLAAQRGQTLYVQVQEGPQWCWAVATDTGCGCGAPQACQLHAVNVADHPGVRLLTPAAVRLDALGSAQVTGAVTFESPQGERLRVDVTPQGRTRICAAAGRWPAIPACS